MKIKTQGGLEHEITELDYDVEKEAWVKITVEDGTTLHFRTTITGIARSNQYGPDGKPLYFVNSTNQLRSKVDEKLCKKPKKPIEKSDTVEGYT